MVCDICSKLDDFSPPWCGDVHISKTRCDFCKFNIRLSEEPQYIMIYPKCCPKCKDNEFSKEIIYCKRCKRYVDILTFLNKNGL